MLKPNLRPCTATYWDYRENYPHWATRQNEEGPLDFLQSISEVRCCFCLHYCTCYNFSWLPFTSQTHQTIEWNNISGCSFFFFQYQFLTWSCQGCLQRKLAVFQHGWAFFDRLSSFPRLCGVSIRVWTHQNLFTLNFDLLSCV